MAGSNQRLTYRIAIAIAVVTCLLTVWTTIVRDDGTGGAYFMMIMAVIVGWFAAGFQAAGMARTMVGIAVMQGLNGLLVATAPVTANQAGGASWALLLNAMFAGLWLGSAAMFRSASRANQAAA